MAMRPKTFRTAHMQTKPQRSLPAQQRAKIYQTKQWELLRRQVLIRDAMQCAMCKKLATGKGNAHVDHIVPAKTEEDVLCSIDNLRLLCRSCHSSHTLKERNNK